jgi:hypothetical protein
MACLSWYIDVQNLADYAPLLSSLPDTYSQCVLSQFSLYHTSRFYVAFSQVLVLETMLILHSSLTSADSPTLS